MFKRNYYISILMSILFVLTISLAALATEESTKLDLKIKQTEEMVNQGIDKKLDHKKDKYYRNNDIIDDSKITDCDSSEAKELIKVIEKSMDDFDNELKSKLDNDFSTNLGGGGSSGSNSIDYSSFENGDIVLVHDGFCIYGYYRHAGTYDEDKDKFISAQKNDLGNSDGVIWEDKDWYRDNYDEAVGVWVVDATSEIRTETRDKIMDYLRDQLGEPYIFSSYNNRSSWYCSKLPWVGWEDHYECDLNENGGFCVPDDLEKSDDTKIFASSS